MDDRVLRVRRADGVGASFRAVEIRLDVAEPLDGDASAWHRARRTSLGATIADLSTTLASVMPGNPIPACFRITLCASSQPMRYLALKVVSPSSSLDATTSTW
jgi:hypothetical protein